MSLGSMRPPGVSYPASGCAVPAWIVVFLIFLIFLNAAFLYGWFVARR